MKLPSFEMPTAGALAFAARTTAASLIALYIAFLMNLDDPQWAPATVWIVAQANRGMAISKCQYRILGTAVGAVVALALIAAFAQTPELFLLSLAVWIGLCTGIATFLRNFRAYGAVLAGYTAAIISMASVANPEHAIDIAISRVIYIDVGILTEAMLTAMLAPESPLRDLRALLARYVQRTAVAASQALRRQPDGAAAHGPFADVLGVDTAIEYAASGSSAAARAAGHLRRAALAALTMHAAAQTIKQHGTREALRDPLCEETATLLTATPGVGMHEVDSLAERVEQAVWTESRSPCANTSRLLMLDRLSAVLAAFRETHASWMLADEGTAPRSGIRYAFHNDATLAIQNGLRAFCAMAAVSIFWILSAWPSGAGAVATVGVVCALFSTRPNSVGAAFGFLKGAICAALVGILCNFALFPAISGSFLMLAGVLGVVVIPAGIAMRSPRTAAVGNAFAIFFWKLTSLSNTARLNDALFLNSMVATLLAIAFGTLVFAVFFPANEQAMRRRLLRSSRGDLIDIANRPQKWTASEWLSRMADRVSRAISHSSARSKVEVEGDLDDLLSIWTIGNSVLQLASLGQQEPAVKRAVELTLRRLAAERLERLPRTCDRAACHLLRRATVRGDTGRHLLRGVASLHAISEAAGTRSALFRDRE